mgnify:FL=1
MHSHADKTSANQSQAMASDQTQKHGREELSTEFADMRPEAIAQRQLSQLVNNST